ncbi:MAG: hypothetical protein PVI92_11470 [Chromatiales bacterium]|jgi:hypothetical protein
MFDIADVRFIKRIVIGSDNPERMKTEEEINEAVALLNRCLTDLPKGTIIGTEKNFALLNIGEHQVVFQYVVYHIGFSRKPFWIE